MSFHFAPAPLNFQKFLDLTRSGSRSLSPENELRQMTASSISASHTKPDALLSCSTVYSSDARAELLRRPSINNLPGSKLSLKASSSSVEEDFLDATESSLVMYTSDDHEDCLKKHDFAESELSGCPHHEVMRELIEEFKTFSLWQYGSPFYYPVTDQFYCWNLHPLRRKYKHEYHGMDGISCDFCGYTEWLTVNDELESTLASFAKRTAFSGEGRDGSTTKPLNPRRPNQSKTKGVKEEEALEGSQPCVSFHHCSVCQVDLCAACIADIRSDDRYHAPCQQCLRCKAYLSHLQAAAHRCRGSKFAMRAVSVEKEKAEGVKRQGPPFSRAEECPGLKADLLPSSAGYDECQSRTRKCTKNRREAKLMRDEPCGIQTPNVKEFDSILSISSSDNSKLFEINTPSFPLKQKHWEEVEYNSAASHSTGKAEPPRRSPASRQSPMLENGWEACISASTSEEILQVDRIAKEVSVKPVQQKVNVMQKTLYRFKMPTRLAAENCARLAGESGLCASLKKF
ncbi:unnamed protein product [Phytomonas sp. Hart1]|nr:unnamed protein product [Phytomonas sp. Hart1]|eukprot:CCW66432.1 unnamed protein product [Phytomonas sp. isolate Hart1]